MRARFQIYAWSVLAFHLAVVLWGAFVRASGSGAGCGEHWPLCNGQIVPTAQLDATIIEFSHRATSGIALVSVVLLAVWASRAFPRGSGVRGSALLALMSALVECAIGAALVLLRLVAANESLSRGLWLAAHQVNTLLLLAALSLTAWQAGNVRARDRGYPPLSRQIIGLSIVGFFGAEILGTFAALGDTLTEPASLTAGIRADFFALSNIFVRLRILHPIVAVSFGVWLVLLTFRVSASPRANAVQKRFAGAIATLVLAQFALGITNILLRTPIWLQLLHLLNADLVWIMSLILGYELVRRKPEHRRVSAADRSWVMSGQSPTRRYGHLPRSWYLPPRQLR